MMKYYIYISDAKVDMLLPQIPHDVKKKIATEYKIDFKVLGVSRKAETETEENRITRLEAVVAFIQEYGELGSADEPRDYIQDTLTMSWGTYSSSTSQEAPLVYFVGRKNKTDICLGGSPRHVLGNVGIERSSSSSSLPDLIKNLVEGLDSRGLDLKDLNLENQIDTWDRLGGWRELRKKFTGTDLALLIIQRAICAAREGFVEQRLEFLAKRLLYGPPPLWLDTRRLLLASPLYVAMAE